MAKPGRPPNDRTTAIGKRLTAIRAKLGITQDQAAAAIGTSKQTWYSWEIGRRTPNAAYLKLIGFLADGTIQTPAK